MTSLIADIEQVAFSYNDQVVLENVNLKIFEGDFVAMIGPNGGGKTTLLKLILGLLPPSKGKIHIFDRPPQKASYLIGYVPQDVHINQNFPITAMDVVLMGKLLPGKRWQRNPLKDRQEAMAACATWKWKHLQTPRSGNCRVDNVNGYLLRVLLSPDPGCCFWTNPPPASTPKVKLIFSGSWRHLTMR